MCEHRHLALDQRDAAIGATGAAGVLEGPLLHDLRAKTRGCAAQRVGIELVVVMRTDHQQPAFPLLPHEILPKRVREHRARRSHVDDVDATILLAQAIIDGAGVKQDGPAIAQGIRDFQDFIRRQIQDDVAIRAGELVRRRDHVVSFLEPHLGQRKMLIEEPAGGVVILDRQLRAGHAVIFHGLFDQRQGRFDAGVA